MQKRGSENALTDHVTGNHVAESCTFSVGAAENNDRECDDLCEWDSWVEDLKD